MGRGYLIQTGHIIPTSQQRMDEARPTKAGCSGNEHVQCDGYLLGWPPQELILQQEKSQSGLLSARRKEDATLNDSS